MHAKYGIHDKVNEMDLELLRKMAVFRSACIQEELDEFKTALDENDAEESVDALIDIIVFAVGTLDLYGVNFDKAWKTVHEANMNKSVGIKPGRPNPLGLPDLIKPSDWQSPCHKGNHAKFGDLEKG